MIFEQLFDPLSSTYSYLLGCEQTGQALLIDPVIVNVERDLSRLQALGLSLSHTLDTHIHADHITAARELRERVGSLIVAPAIERLACADIAIEDEQHLQIGEIILKALHTPGHTPEHFAYQVNDRLFSGDALLIDGCGRTDFQGGDPQQLYQSVHDKLFTLPDETQVFPGHDYRGRRLSTIGQEKRNNARLGGGRSLAEFVALMRALELPYPQFMKHAVPGNRQCGICPDTVPQDLQQYCGKQTDSPQG